MGQLVLNTHGKVLNDQARPGRIGLGPLHSAAVMVGASDWWRHVACMPHSFSIFL